MEIKVAAQYALDCLDLTSLNNDDTEDTVKALCQKAQTNFGPTAAVCVWPRFVRYAKAQLQETSIKVAAVANFPDGNADIDQALTATKQIIDAGGDEVDVVFPYRALMRGDTDTPKQLVKACKSICGTKVKLKVILETGELKTAELIQQASEISLQAGADFIKTSTGKSEISATIDAADIMLEAIKKAGHGGFKASGGIKDTETAQAYLALATEKMGADWVQSNHFRFGASGVLTNLIATLSDQEEQANNSAY